MKDQALKSGNVTWYQRANDDWPASEIIGTVVRNSAGENIADVNELILANDGKVRAVIIASAVFWVWASAMLQWPSIR